MFDGFMFDINYQFNYQTKMQKLFSTHHTMQVLEGENVFLKYTVVGKLGAGNNNVFLATNNETKVELALKEVSIKDDESLKYFRTEVQLLAKINEHQHPNIIKFYDYCVLSRESEYEQMRLGYILLERCTTSLDKVIVSRQRGGIPFDKNIIRSFFIKMVKVHMYLQELKIAHCDIKPENILIQNSKTLDFKVCDIGSAKFLKNEATQNATIGGTPSFFSPELWINMNHHRIDHNPFKCDVYSLGLCMVYLISFNKFTQAQRKILSLDTFSDVMEEWKRQTKVMSENDPMLNQCLQHMLQLDTKLRPDFVKLNQIIQQLDAPDINELTQFNSDSENTPLATLQDSALTSPRFDSPPNKQKIFAARKLKFQSKADVFGSQSNIFKIHPTSTLQAYPQSTPIQTIKKHGSHARLPQINQPTHPQSNFSSIRLNQVNTVQSPNLRRMLRTNGDEKASNSGQNFFPQQVQGCRGTPQRVLSISRKGHSLANLKTNPCDVKSMHTTKSQYFVNEQQQSQKRIKTLSSLSYQAKLFKNLKELQDFADDFNEASDFNGFKCILQIDQQSSDCYQMFSELSRLKRITELTLNIEYLFETRKHSPAKLHSLFESMKTLEDLEKLEFNCLGFKCTDEDIQSIQIQTLKELQISLSQVHSEYSTIDKLIQSFSQNQLQSLSISLDAADIGISGVTGLLQNQQQLQYFSLTISQGKINEIEHKQFYDTLYHIRTLRTLIIKKTCCQLNLKQAQWNLNPNLLELHIEYDRSQLEDALSSLALGLMKLTKIKSLSLGLKAQDAQAQYLKLLIEYVKRLKSLIELKLDFSNIIVFDDEICSVLCEKLKYLSNLEVLQLSLENTCITEKVLESILNMAYALRTLEALTQIEVVLPRITSLSQIQTKSTFKMDCRIQYVSVETICVYFIDKIRMKHRLDYYGNGLDMVLNSCSEKDYYPTFSCLTCQEVPPILLNLCLQCTENCHKGHYIVVNQFIARQEGFYNKLKQCQCIAEGCSGFKRQSCNSVFGDQIQWIRICETCNNNHLLCRHCSVNNHTAHQVRVVESLMTFKCCD